MPLEHVSFLVPFNDHVIRCGTYNAVGEVIVLEFVAVSLVKYGDVDTIFESLD